MIVHALFFAHYQDVAGTKRLPVDLAENATVRDFVLALEARDPQFHQLLSYARIAVNTEFATPETTLSDGDEVAVLPPMSGG